MTDTDITTHIGTPPVEAGKFWVCEDGHRHFVCFFCEDVFITANIYEHNCEADDPDALSICDTCQNKLRRIGLIP